ncbi:conserved hypothetical protein [Ricinus communis]|uniref:Uncharacterized protein n=1 Tax=Ricinus communis TaxID=3988 RepID=B9RHI2_RICCO|nr:conserved hypothetical protein [Ricinus communis]
MAEGDALEGLNKKKLIKEKRVGPVEVGYSIDLKLNEVENLKFEMGHDIGPKKNNVQGSGFKSQKLKKLAQTKVVDSAREGNEGQINVEVEIIYDKAGPRLSNLQ